jgi:hypothetical protein
VANFLKTVPNLSIEEALGVIRFLMEVNGENQTMVDTLKIANHCIIGTVQALDDRRAATLKPKTGSIEKRSPKHPAVSPETANVVAHPPHPEFG